MRRCCDQILCIILIIRGLMIGESVMHHQRQQQTHALIRGVFLRLYRTSTELNQHYLLQLQSHPYHTPLLSLHLIFLYIRSPLCSLFSPPSHLIRLYDHPVIQAFFHSSFTSPTLIVCVNNNSRYCQCYCGYFTTISKYA